MQDILDYLTGVIEEAKAGEISLKDAKKALTKARNAIKKIDSAIVKLSSADYKRSCSKKAMKEIEANANSVLVENLELAIAINLEFSEPSLYNPLIRIAKNKNIFSISVRDNGWGSSLQVDHNWEELGGDVQEWGRAIDAVRVNNEWSEYSKKPNPQQASRYWKFFVFATELFNSTTAERLAESDSPAPFWYILNYGTTPLVSDWGGSPYPVNRPTHFVENSIDNLKQAFRVILREFHLQTNIQINDLKETKLRISHLMEAISNLIATFTQEVGSDKSGKRKPAKRTAGKITQDSKSLERVVETLDRTIVGSAEVTTIPSTTSEAVLIRTFETVKKLVSGFLGKIGGFFGSK